jgi:hypothetical protein
MFLLPNFKWSAQNLSRTNPYPFDFEIIEVAAFEW